MLDKETKLSLQKKLINVLSVLKKNLIFEDTAFYCFLSANYAQESRIYKLASHDHVTMVSRRHAIKNKMSMSLEMRITFMIKMWTKVRITMGKGTRTRLRRSIRMEIRMGMILGNEDEMRMWMGIRIKMRIKMRIRARMNEDGNEGKDEDEDDDQF